MLLFKNIWLIILLIYLPFLSEIKLNEGEAIYKSVPEQSQVNIKGTSTLNDWQMGLITSECKVFLTEWKSEIISIEKAEFRCNVEDITCSESLMIKKARDAFNYNKNPDIIFTSNSIEDFISQKGRFSGKAKGELSMAGRTKKTDVDFKGSVNIVTNTIKIEATKKIDMTEWGMTPPTAMMGMMKTGKEVTIVFKINLMK